MRAPSPVADPPKRPRGRLHKNPFPARARTPPRATTPSPPPAHRAPSADPIDEPLPADPFAGDLQDEFEPETNKNVRAVSHAPLLNKGGIQDKLTHAIEHTLKLSTLSNARATAQNDWIVVD